MNRLSLRLKLVLAFLLVAVIVAGTSFYSVLGIQETERQLKQVINGDFARIEILQKIQLVASATQHDTWSLANGILPLTPSSTQPGPHFESEQGKMQQLLADYNELREGEIKLETQAIYDRITQEIDTMFELAQQQSAAPSSDLLSLQKLENNGEELDVSLSTLLDTEDDNIAEEYNIVSARTAQLTYLATLAIGGAFVVSILLGVVVASSISRRMQRIKVGADNIAAGNLSETLPVTTRDELGSVAQSFNNMAQSLRNSYTRLALEKERDETLLASMSEGMVALDNEGRVVLINTVAAALLELTADASTIGVQLTTLIALHDESDQPIAPQQMPTALTLQDGQPTAGVYARHTKDQRRILINIATNPVKLEGNIAGAVVIMRDVTKEKEVDRMKTEFISLASHQLRTPLSAIKWFSEMLLEGDAGKLTLEQMEFASNIFDSTSRMVDLVNSLLNISRIESGRIIVDPRPTDLRDLIGGIVHDLKAKTQEKQQTLAISVHSDLPKINLDPRLVGQVYLNLLTNAIKYTPKQGEISVFVSKRGNDVISQVTDNGYGIPKDQQGRIFQKFFRAGNVAKIETDGTGLGLYLIKAIVESSGGKIWFESAEGKGTSFWFTLPLSGMKPKAGEVTLDS